MIFDLLLKCILTISGLWIVCFGEFFECVFFNDKFDLVQVEVIVDFIDVSLEQVVCLVFNLL